MFYIGQVKFHSFNMAAICALNHARQQRMQVRIKNDDGAVLVDFVPGREGTVMVQPTEYGRDLMEDFR